MFRETIQTFKWQTDGKRIELPVSGPKGRETPRDLVLFKGLKSSFAEEAKIAMFSIRVFPKIGVPQHG